MENNSYFNLDPTLDDIINFFGKPYEISDKEEWAIEILLDALREEHSAGIVASMQAMRVVPMLAIHDEYEETKETNEMILRYKASGYSPTSLYVEEELRGLVEFLLHNEIEIAKISYWEFKITRGEEIKIEIAYTPMIMGVISDYEEGLAESVENAIEHHRSMPNEDSFTEIQILKSQLEDSLDRTQSIITELQMEEKYEKMAFVKYKFNLVQKAINMANKYISEIG